MIRTAPAGALAIALTLAFPTVAQRDEAEPYFSLHSERTFAPGETPQLKLWGQGIDQLQFRVYRVNDPVKFFEQLEDPRQFGGRNPRAPGELTRIERFHQWKLRARSSIRNLFRAQYTADSRATIRHAMARSEQTKIAPAPAAVRATEYAGVPVLNQQQLVAVWEQPVSRANRWQTQTVPVDVKERGVYLVEATNGKLQAYSVVCVTSLATIVKGAPGKVVARVVERATGKPVAGARVIVWASRKEQASVVSDAAGIATAPVSVGQDESVLLLTSGGDDFTPASAWGWNIGSADNPRSTAYVYTDRPVYRPGHTVHFRGVLRTAQESGYGIPRAPMDVEVQDVEGKPVFRQSVTPSALGTINADLTLPAAASLGYYSVLIRSGGQYVGTGGFHVEEYKKPEYEVKVAPVERRILQGSEAQATVDARYYFGEPVPGAKVQYVVHRSRYWPPYYLEDMEDEEPGEDNSFGENEQVIEAEGLLDAQGRLQIRFPTEAAPHDTVYRIEARVTDQANREISGSGYLIATRGSYFVHIEPDKYLYRPGERARLRVEARDYDGNPVPNTGFEVDLIEAQRGKEGTVLGTASGRTADTGVGSVEMTVKGGSLVARVRSRTPEGREVDDRTWLWVNGGFLSDYGGEQRIEIVPDKKTYKTGETARLLIVTGIPEAWVWVSTESRGLYESKLVHATSASVSVDFPVRAEYAPNFYVNAALIHEGRLLQGVKSVRVPPVTQQMNVKVKASQAQFKPGETGTFAIEATDWQGNPVQGGEFSLGVVDEAIYAIRREAAQDIMKFFYGRAHNAISTDSSLNYSFHGEAGKRRMQLAMLNADPFRRRGQIKPDKFVDPRVRKAFPDTIYWSGALRTDAQGRAEARMEFPDALTTWRATARGITADTKVGSAVDRTIVRKNLILRLGVPRFLVEGDEVTIPAIVQNYLTAEKNARVSLEVQGADVIEGGARDVQVTSRGMAQVNFRLKARTPGKLVLLGRALTDEESDALELTIPIEPYGVKMSDAKAGSLPGSTGEAAAEFAFPADANPAARALEISLTPSLAGVVFGALDYLTSFPYGCTEQTMSSFLPNVIVSRATRELGLRRNVNEAELTKKVRAGLDRLYDFQHPDGGWGWWKTDDSQVFMTAYVLSGLARAKTAGQDVRQDAIDRGANWLNSDAARINDRPEDLRAYVAHALAENGKADKAKIDALWSARSALTPYGRALLGLAMRAIQDPRAASLAETLEREAKVEESEAYWPLDQDRLLEISIDATPEATAYAVRFLNAERPDSPLLPKAAAYLVNHRNEGYYWSSTKQTAMVVYGLTDYLKRTGELNPDFSATVYVNDRPVLTKRFTKEDVLSGGGQPLRVTDTPMTPSANRVRIQKSGAGTLYWNARAEYYSPAARQSQGGSGTLGIEREYFRLVPEQSGDKIVHRLEPLAGAVKTGDVIAVRLRVLGSEWRYIMVEDPIPAGTEFIERDDLYELREKPPWWARMYARREFHDDHAALFQTYLRAGGSEQSYLLKVVNPGQFRVGPAKVQPMYQPRFFATTSSRNVEVQ